MNEPTVIEQAAAIVEREERFNLLLQIIDMGSDRLLPFSVWWAAVEAAHNLATPDLSTEGLGS